MFVTLFSLGCSPPARVASPPASTAPLTLPAPTAAALPGGLANVLPDLDGDGATDVVTVAQQRLSGGPGVYDPVDQYAVALWPDLLHGGAARYLSASVYRTDDKSGTDIGLTAATPAGDLDGDGEQDLYLTGMDYETYLVPGPFPATDLDVLARAAGAVASWQPLGPVDADGDGADDLLVASYDVPDPGAATVSSGLALCAGPDPDLSLTTCPTRPLPGWWSPVASAHADLDGDGVEEIVVGDRAAGSGYASDQLLAVSADDLRGDPYFVVQGGASAAWLEDFDGDGDLDLLWQPSGQFGTPLYGVFGPLVRGATYSADGADLVVDLTPESQFAPTFVGILHPPGRAPLAAIAGVGPGGLWLFALAEPGTFTADDGLEVQTSSPYVRAAIADLDADGSSDLLVWDVLSPDQIQWYSFADAR